MEFNRGDFVEYRGIRYVIKDINDELCDLIDPWEEKWNVSLDDLILIAKYKDLQHK